MNSVLDYPDRGPWGDARFHGNTTGYLVKDLIDQFGARRVMDPMEGSGTSGDVCKDYGDVAYHGFDLAQGHDLLSPDFQASLKDQGWWGSVDLVFWHPPYWSMISYNPGNARDFSSGTYVTYLRRMRSGIEFLIDGLGSGSNQSRLAILVGNLRREGKYYFIAKDILANLPRNVAFDQELIKLQRQVSSRDKVYRGEGNLIRIAHEYVLLLRRAI